MGAWSFAIGLIASFGLVYLAPGEFGVSYVQLSAISIAASIGAILAGFEPGYVIDRLGARAYTAVLMLTAPLTGLVWFINHTLLTFSFPMVGRFDVPQAVVLQVLASLAAVRYSPASGSVSCGCSPRWHRVRAGLWPWRYTGP